MNTWRQQFEKHPLHSDLSAINTLISGASLKTKDAGILDAFNRLIVVLNTFSQYVRAINPECTTKGYLDNIHAPIQQLKPSLEQFLKDENAAHLQNANNQADQLVQRMPPFALPETAVQHADSISNLVKAVEGIIAALSAQAKENTDVLEKIKSAANATEQKLQQTDKTIESQKARLDSAIAEFQKQFSETEASRRKQIELTENSHKSDIDKFKEKITGDVSALIEDQKKQFLDLSTKLKADGGNIITDMESKKNAAAKVLNVSTNVAVSGGYGKYAHHEKIAAEAFRFIALIFMCALIYGAYKTIEVALHVTTIDWTILLIRAITTFTLAIPAFYAVRESNKHRLAEHRYRKMQLELAAIDPYLELIDKGKREEMKLKLTERFFAQPEIRDSATDVDAGSLLDIIKQVLTTLLKK